MAPSGALFFCTIQSHLLRSIYFLALSLLVVMLQACATKYSLLTRVIDELQSQAGVTGGDAHIPAKPDLAYRYLRVDIEGRKTALMVLAFEEAHPNGAIEVWYSASGQVIKMQNSRVIATSGLETDWLRVQYSPQAPEWSQLSNQPTQYSRLRDEMPGYRYAVADALQLSAVQGVPAIRLPQSLPPATAQSYRWFQERSSSTLPPAWYAWGVHRGQATVVYSEQCLSAQLCLKLQRWPLQEAPF
jgi:hypothetical protein